MKGGRERKKERNLDARDGTEQKNRLKQSTESGRKKRRRKKRKGRTSEKTRKREVRKRDRERRRNEERWDETELELEHLETVGPYKQPISFA